jgi:hypothetical protein
MTKFEWIKKGLVFEPNLANYSYGFLPCVHNLIEDNYLVAFSCRDKKQKSHIFLAYAKASNGEFFLTSPPKHALSPGPLGHFDGDGALSSCFIQINSRLYLYYGGWENLANGMYRTSTGRLLVDPISLTLEREFSHPILSRTNESPIFTALHSIIPRNGELWGWGISVSHWEERPHESLRHHYSVRRAVSTNGVDWKTDNYFCIPFADEYEYAIARASVVEIGNVFYMWFSRRATQSVPTYRIGLATSLDGITWERKDATVGIDTSINGWDSEMICYPYVFKHKGWLYMLYNGNGYGRTGFGYASAVL